MGQRCIKIIKYGIPPIELCTLRIGWCSARPIFSLYTVFCRVICVQIKESSKIKEGFSIKNFVSRVEILKRLVECWLAIRVHKQDWFV